ncbi:MATE family efflux transporter [Pseudodonghicola sp.]|uniref:MATE family efflux transporter n=1 Tax=Pseudodonghicola sp. TaxID=1969463 RepID=UPI003A98812A
MMDRPPENKFLTGSLLAAYARTAVPIITVMGMSGLLTVVDALFLGRFAGPEALAAVTLLFPVYMIFVALATLVAGGMSSLLARRLGARDMGGARAVFAGAHGLALAVALGMVVLVMALGGPLTGVFAGAGGDIAAQALVYLRIVGFAAPVMFLLSVETDALRNEGRAGLMAGLSLLVSLLNIGLDALFVAGLGLGVAGSAWGTVLAQGTALGLLAVFRLRAATPLPLRALTEGGLCRGWGAILALGAPQSLSFLGISLVSAAIVATVGRTGGVGYADTLSAYGIVTRMMTFAVLPLVGLVQAMQTITGTNFGAGDHRRTDDSLRLALVLALVYGLVVQTGLSLGAQGLGRLFVADGAVVQEVGHILPVMVTLFLLTGPLMILGGYFQAVGDVPRAAVLGLAKPYLFSLPLIFVFSGLWGVRGIWWASPAAEAGLLMLTLVVLARAARRRPARWGVFLA